MDSNFSYSLHPAKIGLTTSYFQISILIQVHIAVLEALLLKMHNQATNFDTDGNELTIQKFNAHTETKLKK